MEKGWESYHINILGASCLEKQESSMWVINQHRNGHQVSSLAYGIWLTEAAGVATTYEEAFVRLEGAKVEDMQFHARWAIR